MPGPSVQLIKGLFFLLKGLACVMLWTFFLVLSYLFSSGTWTDCCYPACALVLLLVFRRRTKSFTVMVASGFCVAVFFSQLLSPNMHSFVMCG